MFVTRSQDLVVFLTNGFLTWISNSAFQTYHYRYIALCLYMLIYIYNFININICYFYCFILYILFFKFNNYLQ